MWNCIFKLLWRLEKMFQFATLWASHSSSFTEYSFHACLLYKNSTYRIYFLALNMQIIIEQHIDKKIKLKSRNTIPQSVVTQRECYSGRVRGNISSLNKGKVIQERENHPILLLAPTQPQSSLQQFSDWISLSLTQCHPQTDFEPLPCPDHSPNLNHSSPAAPFSCLYLFPTQMSSPISYYSCMSWEFADMN